MKNICGMSVIVPFLNEEESIVAFCDAFDNYVEEISFPVELIFVDDGSTDNTDILLKSYSFKSVKEAKVIHFTRSFGAQAAIRAGILNAQYNICTWISVDLQEPLDMIPISYEKIISGLVDIIYIEKEEIAVSPLSRFFSKRYNSLMRKYAIKNYPSGGIGAVVFNEKVRNYLNSNIEINSAIVLQLLNAGFRYELIPMKFLARRAGNSKWTFSKKIKIFIDSFVSFSYMPIRVVSIVGIIMFLGGLVIALATIVNKLLHPLVPVGYSTIVSALAVGFGITNISLGIVAEYLWRTFDVSRHQEPFIISNEVNLIECKQTQN